MLKGGKVARITNVRGATRSIFRKVPLLGFGLIISQEISLTHQRARLALRTLFAGGAVPWSFKLQV
jgi:hypothetical protein